MPLLDHFRPPIHPIHPCKMFHSGWATRLADRLNLNWLSREFIAQEFTSTEQLEIDIATLQRPLTANGQHGDGSQTVALMPKLWTAPAATATMPGVFPDTFEVRVYSRQGGMDLVGAIELVSPSNKDRPHERRAFATKCASYLHQGVSVIIVDIVTTRHANLHNEIIRLMQANSSLELSADADLYAISYRPVRRETKPEIDLWPVTLSIGSELPTMPLRLTGDLFVPVELEITYSEACRLRRIPD